MEAYVIIFFFALLAAFVQRISGFGFGIVIMTVLPFFMPSYGEATTLSGALAMVQSLLIVATYYKQIRWRTLLPFLFAFLIVSFFAVQFVSRVDDVMLKHILGIILILMSIYFLFFNGTFRIRPTIYSQIGLGSCSGLLGGFCAMQGPPAVIYFLDSEPTKEGYIANLQAFFLLGNLGMTIYRAQCGFLTSAVGINWLSCLLAIAIGSYLGNLVFRRLSATKLRTVVYLYMLLSGIIALFAH